MGTRNRRTVLGARALCMAGAVALLGHACSPPSGSPDGDGAGGSAESGAPNEGGHAGANDGPTHPGAGGRSAGGDDDGSGGKVGAPASGGADAAAGGNSSADGAGGAEEGSGGSDPGAGGEPGSGGAGSGGEPSSGGAGSGGAGSGGAGSGGAGSGGAGSGGTGGSDPVNGCTTFVARTATGASRALAWGFGIATAPERCMRVQLGQAVTFNGDFSTHPIGSAGGDSPNPITGNVPVGADEYTVTFQDVGTFGYECLIHSTMRGAISVVP